MTDRQRTRLLLLAVLALALTLRLWGIRFGLPHDFTRPDEEKIVGAAIGIFRGDFNPHLFLYPSVFIYLTALAYGAVFAVQTLFGWASSHAEFASRLAADPSLSYLVPRVLSAALGTLTVGALYAAVREAGSRRSALAAAALLSVAFLHVRDSHFATTDVATAFFVVCAAGVGVRCLRRGVSAGRVAIAGVLAGLAASTKYNAALAVMPAFIAIVHERRATVRATVWRWGAFAALLGMAAAVAFLIGTPYALLDRATFWKQFTDQWKIQFEGQGGPILELARAAVHERGWLHHVGFNLRYGVGVPLLAAAIAGAVWMAASEPWAATVIVAVPLLYYVQMWRGQLVYARYMVTLVPFLCWTAGWLLDRLAARMSGGGASRVAQPTFVLVLLIAVAGPTTMSAVQFDRLMTRPDSRLVAADWIRQAYPNGASMYQTGFWYSHVEPGPADRFVPYGFDGATRRFVRNRRDVDDAPDLVVVLRSPLTIFGAVPDGLEAVLSERYELTWSLTTAARDTAPGLYDQQDAFFVPLGNLASVRRPGPDVAIYVRRR